MYNSLLFAVKDRILDECKDAFNNHPQFSSKVKVYNSYPYTERVQFGLVLRNSSASQIRLQADNFMSDLFSHVKLTKQNNYPGLAIEWAREDQGWITEQITGEDVSSQLGANQRQFYTRGQMLAGPGETHYADSPGQVIVYVNGNKVVPEAVSGKDREILLYDAPGPSSTVTVDYHIRRLTSPGIYTIDFITDTQFTVNPKYIISKEVLIKKTLGTEVTVNLQHTNIDPNSETISLTYYNGTYIDALIKGTDYSIDYTTGLVTFLLPLPSNYSISADYLYIPTDFFTGPFNFIIYQENHVAIPGVILSIGRRAKQGDQQVIVVSQFREQQAKIYGGHWQMSLDLAVIAKDPIQMAEMTDQVVNWLWAVRKNQLEFEGLTLNSVEPSGESQEVHNEVTGDLYYESSVTVSIQTEWQNIVPYNFFVSLRNVYLYPDLRPTFKGPIVGYERLT